MSVETHLRKIILRDTVVSGMVADRIYKSKAPQNAQLPHIFYTRDTGGGLETTRGEDDHYVSQFEFNCIAASADDATTLTNAVRKCLKNYRGFDAGNEISRTYVENDIEDAWSEATGLFRRILEVEVSHNN